MNLSADAVMNLICVAQRMVPRLSEVEARDLQDAIDAVRYDGVADHARAAARKLGAEELTLGDIKALQEFMEKNVHVSSEEKQQFISFAKSVVCPRCGSVCSSDYCVRCDLSIHVPEQTGMNE